MEAIARQPESVNDIRTNMIIIAALVEGVALFAVVMLPRAVKTVKKRTIMGLLLPESGLF